MAVTRLIDQPREYRRILDSSVSLKERHDSAYVHHYLSRTTFFDPHVLYGDISVQSTAGDRDIYLKYLRRKM